MCLYFQDGTNLIVPSRDQLNLSEIDQIYAWLNRKRPTSINAAAFTDVDGAENNRQEASALNAQLPSVLASWCEFNHSGLLHLLAIMFFQVVKQLSSMRLDTKSTSKLVSMAKNESHG